jgi:hypothetical protein
VAAAGLWAIITASTGYQIGFMAVGVGFVVGYTIRLLGKGIDPVFGYAGSALALLGCVLGNILAASAILASQENVPFFDILAALDLRLAADLLVAWFSPIDVLFYGIAVYEGYKLSFRQLSEQELLDLVERSHKGPAAAT